MKTSFLEFIKENTISLKDFLDEFPNDAKSWRYATDEIRDIARKAKEYINELQNADMEACNFKSFKTPSQWNTEGKKYIMKVYNKMNERTKKEFDDYLFRSFNIK